MIFRRNSCATVAVLFILLVEAFAQEPKNQTAPAAAQGTTQNDSTYVIAPEDVLSVSVWKEPDVSGTVPVRPDGRISLPLLNDVQAAGMTPMQLMNDVTEKLKKFISDPRVTVTVTTINSRKVYVLGEVAKPGAVPLAPEMTVLQALTSAGGPTPYAKASKMYVLRKQNGAQSKLPFNYKEVVKGRNMDQDITLKPGDTVVVP
jgi:polysaccharide export outer membrane protein